MNLWARLYMEYSNIERDLLLKHIYLYKIYIHKCLERHQIAFEKMNYKYLIFIHNWEHENKMILLKFNSQMPWYRVVNNECLQVVIQGLGAILAMFKQFQTLPGILVHDGLFHGSSEGPLLQRVGCRSV